MLGSQARELFKAACSMVYLDTHLVKGLIQSGRDSTNLQNRLSASSTACGCSALCMQPLCVQLHAPCFLAGLFKPLGLLACRMADALIFHASVVATTGTPCGWHARRFFWMCVQWFSRLKCIIRCRQLARQGARAIKLMQLCLCYRNGMVVECATLTCCSTWIRWKSRLVLH